VSDLERRLTEDKVLRDSALALFKADLALVRADVNERGIGARIGKRLGEGTMETLDDAIDYAEENKGKIAAGIAAVILWFARGPILDAIGRPSRRRRRGRRRNLPRLRPLAVNQFSGRFPMADHKRTDPQAKGRGRPGRNRAKTENTTTIFDRAGERAHPGQGSVHRLRQGAPVATVAGGVASAC
jgi:hypothetical protein